MDLTIEVSGQKYPKFIYGMPKFELQVKNIFEFEIKFKFEFKQKRNKKEKKKKRRRSQLGWSRAEAHVISPRPK